MIYDTRMMKIERLAASYQPVIMLVTSDGTGTLASLYNWPRTYQMGRSTRSFEYTSTPARGRCLLFKENQYLPLISQRSGQ